MTALPAGFGFALSTRTHACDDGRSLVGAGGRVVRLSAVAAAVVARAPLTVADDEDGAVAAQVARLLLDRGLADPWWPTPAPADADVTDVTVVVPTRGRAGAVAGLLASLPEGLPVVVVDDGSDDPALVGAVAAEHGARCVRHPRNLGPAAARNTGLRAVRTAYVAFVDSDVRPDAGWLGVLRRHLDDPAVALVAPRVLGRSHRPGGVRESWVERYEKDRSSLDLGPHPAAVRVHSAVSYLPSACLVARVEALGGGFDEDLRAGEDVDLVWRLLADGHGVRYEPAATVRHDHRTRLGAWLGRKAFYGTSAAPLAARHPGAVAPLVVTPWTVVWSVALLAQRRWSLPVA
ncbi:mycofactocin biosynthesis glycosyltransferase MftF, partial [Nocardioides sp.]|uniref:mycofactocin biosynthesis glycosyltransferase MftF n=1 Tax=Nocardioides sp. TaxID=35761 RepID=UPI002726FDE2